MFRKSIHRVRINGETPYEISLVVKLKSFEEEGEKLYMVLLTMNPDVNYHYSY